MDLQRARTCVLIAGPAHATHGTAARDKLRIHAAGGSTTTTRDSGARRPVGRVAVLLGLLLAAGLTIRGRRPLPEAVPRAPAADSPGSTVGLVALLSVSMLVMAIAMFNRRPGPPRPAPREFPEGPRGERSRWNLRLGLVALGLLLVWLLAVIVLNRLGLGPDSRQLTVPTVPDNAGVTPSAAPAAGSPATSGNTYRLLMATTAALVVMTVVATVVSGVRRPRPASLPAGGATPAAAADGPAPLAVAAELGLAEVSNTDLHPREAIIACYAAMEQALAAAPDAAPHVSDTPSGVLARAVAHGALSPASASDLVSLFTEARFSTHVMTEQHRQAAERSLRSVLGELRSPV